MLNSHDVLLDEIRPWSMKQTSHQICSASCSSEEGSQHPATPSKQEISVLFKMLTKCSQKFHKLNYNIHLCPKFVNFLACCQLSLELGNPRLSRFHHVGLGLSRGEIFCSKRSRRSAARPSAALAAPFNGTSLKVAVEASTGCEDVRMV